MAFLRRRKRGRLSQRGVQTASFEAAICPRNQRSGAGGVSGSVPTGPMSIEVPVLAEVADVLLNHSQCA